MHVLGMVQEAGENSVPLGRDCAGVREDLLETEMQLSGEAVAQVAQRGGDAPSLQIDNVRWGSEHCWSCGCLCALQGVAPDGL